MVLLTKNMAIDYGRIGIRVNCICPGFIDTPMFRSVVGNFGAIADKYRDQHKLGRFGRPEEIASAALFLASEDASFVTGHALRRRRRLHDRHAHRTARRAGPHMTPLPWAP